MRKTLGLACSLAILLPACGQDIQEAVEDLGTGESEGLDGDVSDADDGADDEAGDGEAADGGSDPAAEAEGSTSGDGDDGATGQPNGGDESTGGEETTGMGDECQSFSYIEIDADQAQIFGEWELGVSGIAPDEGDIVYPLGSGASGGADFTALLPCADSWRVWVRGLDNDQDDSFFVNVDDLLPEGAIFDLDCSGSFFAQPEYLWAPLNTRPDEFGCGLDNLLELDAGPGQLTVSFSEREQGAISALVITNDPGFDPG